MDFLSEDDLLPFADINSDKAEQMIADATALATLAAPCLGTEPTELTTSQQAAVKAVLRGAILRWHEAGSGVKSQETVGPFGQSIDTRQNRKGMFWPSEIENLQRICNEGTDTSGGAFSITPAVGTDASHQPWCSINFGANYCSCGADIAGFPLYEYP